MYYFLQPSVHESPTPKKFKKPKKTFFNTKNSAMKFNNYKYTVLDFENTSIGIYYSSLFLEYNKKLCLYYM